MTQEEIEDDYQRLLIEKETRELTELTVMLREANLLLDQARQCETQEGKISLLSQIYETVTRFNQEHDD